MYNALQLTTVAKRIEVGQSQGDTVGAVYLVMSSLGKASSCLCRTPRSRYVRYSMYSRNGRASTSSQYIHSHSLSFMQSTSSPSALHIYHNRNRGTPNFSSLRHLTQNEIVYVSWSWLLFTTVYSQNALDGLSVYGIILLPHTGCTESSRSNSTSFRTDVALLSSPRQ